MRLGEPTGVLKESARNLVTKWMPKDSREDQTVRLVDLGKLLLSQGITAAADMGNLEPGDNLPLFQEAARKGMETENRRFTACGNFLKMIYPLI